MLRIIIFVLFAVSAFSYRLHVRSGVRGSSLLIRSARQRPNAEASSIDVKPAFTVGENVPEEIGRHKSIYDMILVERFTAPARTSAGLFLPVVEGKDQKHLATVISVPTEYGLESEQGNITPSSVLAPYQVGDIVLIKV